MKLCWSYNSIPELENLTKEKRQEVWKTCHRRCLKNWKIWISFLLMGICVATGAALGQFYYGRIGGLIGSTIAGSIGGVIIWEMEVEIIRPYIREYLSSHEKPN